MADVPGKFFKATKVRTGVSPSSPGVIEGETLPPVNPPGGSLNSVGLSMPSAFNVANSPLTSNGTIDVTGAGTTAQYIRGDGSLASFPSLTGFVPYTGATQNVDLGEFGVDAGFVNLDTTPTNTPNTQGTIYWDDARSTAALIMNGTIQHIGQDTFFYVKNSTGSSIPKGTAVRFAGTDGASGHLLITPFLANGSVPSTYFMGVTAEVIDNGAFGQVMHFGELEGINTSGYTAGSLLYASTTVAGGFQTTPPVAPNNIVLIAATINSKNNGAILVRPTYGSNINTDEGVKITSPATGQLLQLQAGGLWENKTIAQVLGGTSSQFVKGDGSLDSNVYALNSALASYQLLSAKGQPNGYASLDGNGKVPLAQINDALIGNVNFQGLWNASTNTPTLANPPASGTKGYYYIVSTGGTFAGISFEVGDWIISNGTAWGKVDNTDAVSSVFGRTGNVVAANGDYTTAQVTESGNLYFTQARVSANTDVAANTAARHNAVTLGTANGLSLSTQQLSLGLASGSTTGALSSTDWNTFNNKENAITAGTTAQYFRGDKTFQTLNTAAVPESGNLYFTNARAIASTLTGYVSGAGTISSADSILTAIQKLNGNIGALVTGVSSVNGQTGAVTLTTTNIGEGTNLYFTNARARAALSFAAGSGAYNSTTGVITIPTDNNQIANGANYITAAALSAYLPLAGGTMTGVITTPNGTFGIVIGDDSRLADRNVANTLFLEGVQNNDRGYINFSQTSGNALGAVNGGDLTWRGNVVLHAANFNSYAPTLGGTGATGTWSIAITGNAGTVTNGVVTTGSYSNPSWITALSWTKITDRPTTLAGYGITDAYTQTQVNNLLAGYLPLTGGTLTGPLNGTSIALTAGITPTKTAKNTYAIQIKGGLFGSPRVQVYDLAVDPNAYMGLGTDMSGGAYEFSNYFPRTGGNGRWSVGSWAGDFGTGQYVSGYNEKLFITESAAQFNVALTAISFIRTGGTSSQYLMADGSVSTLTNPVTGTGTTNYLPKFTGTSTIGNSQIFDNGTQVAVATNNAIAYGTQRFLVLGNGAASQVTRFTDGANGDLVFDFPSQGVTRITSQFGTGGSLVFANGTGFNPRMTLDPSGNLGLGVTPSAWFSTIRAIQIGSVGGAFITGNTGAGGSALIGLNAHFDQSTASWIYGTSNQASFYQQTAGEHRWFNAPSGTAGNAISFTQAMTLFATGNLLVGTPSPISDNGARLQVSGTATFTGNVGVGTIPNSKFEIRGSNSVPQFRISREESTNQGFTIQAGGGVTTFNSYEGLNIVYGGYTFNSTKGTDTQTRMVIDSSGNVGIGTPSPATKLHIASTIENIVTNEVLSGGQYALYRLKNASYTVDLGLDNTGLYLDGAGGATRFFNGGGSPRMTITSTGNVGIGTASPETMLHINRASAGGEGGFIFLDNSAGSTLGNKAGIRFATNSGATFSGYGSFIEALNTNAGNGAESLTFGTWDGAARAERMRITSGGNVRILSGGDLEIYPASGSSYTALYNDNDNFNIWNNGSERMRIFSGGNVHIGPTPGADNGARLQVSGGADLLSITRTGVRTWMNQISSGGDYILRDITGNSDRLTIAASTGAATFSSTLTTGGDILVAGSFNPYASANRGNITLNGTSSNILAFTNNSAGRGYILHDGTDIEITNLASGQLQFFVAAGEAFRVLSGRSILTYADLNVGGKINGFDLTTLAPTGTTNIEWRLGRALLATSSVPEDRWIRVQLGNRIYDILAIDRGLA